MCEVLGLGEVRGVRDTRGMKRIRGAFQIAQILFTSAFECNQLNGNLADLWFTELQFGIFWIGQK